MLRSVAKRLIYHTCRGSPYSWGNSQPYRGRPYSFGNGLQYRWFSYSRGSSQSCKGSLFLMKESPCISQGKWGPAWGLLFSRSPFSHDTGPYMTLNHSPLTRSSLQPAVGCASRAKKHFSRLVTTSAPILLIELQWLLSWHTSINENEGSPTLCLILPVRWDRGGPILLVRVGGILLWDWCHVDMGPSILSTETCTCQCFNWSIE